MGYTETLFEVALRGECPGCGPTLADLPGWLEGLYKYCTCCGWVVWADYINGQKPVLPIKDIQTALSGISFSSMPPDVDGINRFKCVIEHPEHRANWPQPERDILQPDEYTWEELEQEVLRLDGHHYYLTNPEEKCGVCGEWAPHKVSEERPNFYGHPYTSSLCCEHFKKIFGPKSHQYDTVTTVVTLGDS